MNEVVWPPFNTQMKGFSIPGPFRGYAFCRRPSVTQERCGRSLSLWERRNGTRDTTRNSNHLGSSTKRARSRPLVGFQAHKNKATFQKFMSDSKVELLSFPKESHRQNPVTTKEAKFAKPTQLNSYVSSDVLALVPFLMVFFTSLACCA